MTKFRNIFDWVVHGAPFPEDGSPIVFKNGTIIHHINRLYHKEDGPALVYPHRGIERWYLFGESFLEEEFWKRVYHD